MIATTHAMMIMFPTGDTNKFKEIFTMINVRVRIFL